MPGKKIFYTEKAPEAKGPYSQAVIHKGVMYISGQIPVDSVTGLMVKGTIEEETETVLNNLKIIVEEAGAGMEDGMPEATVAALAAMGHELEMVSGYDRSHFGRGHVIVCDRENGVLWGGSDPRGDGCAMSL